MKIRPVVAELFHTDRRTDRHDVANSRFLQFCKCARKPKFCKQTATVVVQVGILTSRM